MSPIAAPPIAAPGNPSAKPAVAPKLAAAAKQFEAIFIRQMMSEARKSNFGDTLLGSEAQDTFREMQDSKFADLAAERGVFGLAQSIEKQIGARDDAPAAAPAPAGKG